MRELFNYPNSDEFTQGSIFEGLKVNDGLQPKHGIIITARCDISNNKARNILCLPVYPVKEWINTIGKEIIFRRVRSELIKKISSGLNAHDMSFSVIDIYPYNTIVEIIESERNKDTPDLVKLIKMYKEKELDYSFKFVVNARKVFCDSLISNTEASTYFLEQISSYEVLEPYIVDLSEPVSIPVDIANRLKKEISLKDISDIDAQYLVKGSGKVTYISVLKSPFIEQLLQKFSSYYSRIGTEDIDKESLDFLKEKLNEL